MIFNSLRYACFLPVVVLAYYQLPVRFRPWLLLLASYLFYASWNAAFLFLILALTLANYTIGLLLQRLRGRPSLTTLLMVLGITLNLGVLGYYKYTFFLLESVTAALGWAGVVVVPPQLSIILPLGISFFIFEFIHYLVDVQKGQPPVKSLLTFAVFAAFFPTQIAGPIKRFEYFIPQVERPAPFDWFRLGAGLRLVLIGLFKKVALADNLAPVVLAGFQHIAPGTTPPVVFDAWLAVLAFAMQIYFDFSAYTDIGRGSALMLGFTIPENFMRPYLAGTISEFWRRWHISLSSWLRDYLYIPLGGSRKARYRNLFLTMLIGGLWHGANWTFVFWGALHGLFLVLYWRFKQTQRRDWTGPAHPVWRSIYGAGGWGLTFLVVCIGWVFFRAADLHQALTMLGAMAGYFRGTEPMLMNSQRLFILLVVAGSFAVDLLAEHRQRLLALLQRVRGGMYVATGLRELQPILYALLITLTLIMKPGEGAPFIYFRF